MKYDKKLKNNIHWLIIVNIAFSFATLLSTPESNRVDLSILVNESNKNPEITLKKTICKMGFESIKSGKPDIKYIHPDIVSHLKQNHSENYNISDANMIHIELEGRDICKVITRHPKGFRAFQSVISKDGPIIYRITSLKHTTPKYEDVKELN